MNTYRSLMLFFLFIFCVTDAAQRTILEVRVRDHDAGFFSWFKGVLGLLDKLDALNPQEYQDIKFKLTGGPYADANRGENWWEYYFDQPQPDKKNKVVYREFTLERFLSFCFYAATTDFSRDRAHELIKKYIKIKAPIQKEIDSFVAQHFDGFFIVGIHYRGSDKVAEATATPYELVQDSVQKVVKNLRRPYKIFVATDDQNFLDYIKSKFKNVVCLDFLRATDDKPLHYGDHAKKVEPYLLGKQALIDCVLLSKSDILIRTHSNLSSVSTDFNPTMPVIMLNKGIMNWNREKGR